MMASLFDFGNDNDDDDDDDDYDVDDDNDDDNDNDDDGDEWDDDDDDLGHVPRDTVDLIEGNSHGKFNNTTKLRRISVE